jgi:hypothetical protein
MDSEIDDLHQQYRRGNRTYAQILQAMQALKRKARIHQAPIDDSHVVDINGRVIPFG